METNHLEEDLDVLRLKINHKLIIDHEATDIFIV